MKIGKSKKNNLFKNMLSIYTNRTFISEWVRERVRILYFFIVVFSPPYLLQQVTKVCFEGDEVNPRLELAVEVFVVYGVLLQHHTVSSQKVGHSIRSHRSINIYLILILKNTKCCYPHIHLSTIPFNQTTHPLIQSDYLSIHPSTSRNQHIQIHRSI